MNTPVRPAQGALGVRSMLHLGIAVAADCVRAVPPARRRTRVCIPRWPCDGELKSYIHTEQSSPAHKGSGGAAGTHPWGRPSGRGIEPKTAMDSQSA